MLARCLPYVRQARDRAILLGLFMFYLESHPYKTYMSSVESMFLIDDDREHQGVSFRNYTWERRSVHILTHRDSQSNASQIFAS